MKVVSAELEPVIGLEIHAELETNSKMFCSCPVVTAATVPPNSAVCPICSGMPGTLPVINRRAVEFALRVALALNCTIYPLSVFERKNYFYPDLPKGYQISQYGQPLAQNGYLIIMTSRGERTIRIRRVHLEEDAGKLTHIHKDEEAYSLIDLNRAGIPLLEIVSEPDLHSAEEVRAFALGLRSVLRYLEVNSGAMEKGVLRIEPNVSIRRSNNQPYGTRTEIKNLNSIRALERSVAYEIQRQIELLSSGEQIRQETRGWDEGNESTFLQRVKEEADDYRYFPEPDLSPLVIDEGWLSQIRSDLPELPAAKFARFQEQYQLGSYDASVLIEEKSVADFFEKAVACAPQVPPKVIVNWVSGELFSLLNQAGQEINQMKFGADSFTALLEMTLQNEINQTSAKIVLADMFATGQAPDVIVAKRGLRQISDEQYIEQIVEEVLRQNPDQVAAYLQGKEAVWRWFFGQVMRNSGGRANPSIVEGILQEKLRQLRGTG